MQARFAVYWRSQGANDFAGNNVISGADPSKNRLVRGTQTTIVVNRHSRCARYRAREMHGAGTGCGDRRADGDIEIDPAVAG